jgi:hypothetical protein
MLLSTAVDTHSLEIVKLVIPTNTPTKESFLQDPITNHQLVGTVSYECVHIYYFLCKYNNNPSFAGNLDWFLKRPKYLIKYDLLNLVTLQKSH